MTSHDRDFMNRVVTKIVDIDEGDLVTYSGNYDFYERERTIREANREAAYERQQAKLAKEQRFIDRFTAHAAKAAQVQSRIKALEDRKSTRLNSSHLVISYAVFCLKKNKHLSPTIFLVELCRDYRCLAVIIGAH